MESPPVCLGGALLLMVASLVTDATSPHWLQPTAFGCKRSWEKEPDQLNGPKCLSDENSDMASCNTRPGFQQIARCRTFLSSDERLFYFIFFLLRILSAASPGV